MAIGLESLQRGEHPWIFILPKEDQGETIESPFKWDVLCFFYIT